MPAGGQHQTRAGARRLGGEERFEGMGPHFRSQADTVVAHAHHRLGVLARVGSLALHVHADAAAVGHGVASIHGEVEQHLLELNRIDADEVGRTLAQRVELDIGAEHASEQSLGAGHLGGQLHHAGLGQVPQHEFGVAQHHCEQIAEVVRHAAGQSTNGLYLPGLQELALHVLAGRHAFHHGQQGGRPALGGMPQAGGHGDPDHGPALFLQAPFDPVRFAATFEDLLAIVLVLRPILGVQQVLEGVRQQDLAAPARDATEPIVHL